MSTPVQITVMELWPRESNCCLCDVLLYGCKTGIPMYEGLPVPKDWPHEWAGFDACQACFDKYERNELPMWAESDFFPSPKLEGSK